MQLVISQRLAEMIRDKFPDTSVFHRSWGTVTADHADIPAPEFEYLISSANALPDPDFAERKVIRRLKSLTKVTTGAATKDLELFAELVNAYCKSLPNRWLFVEDEQAGVSNPYLFVRATYISASGRGNDRTPARVTVKLGAINRGTIAGRQITFYQNDLGSGATVEAALIAEEVFPETDELVSTYKEHLEKYEQFRQKFGIQCVAVGTVCIVSKSSWNVQYRNLSTGDTPGRVVLDDDVDWGTSKNIITESKPGSDDNQEETVYRLPDHPYVRAFDLSNHDFATLHVANCDQYIYNRRLAEKLVLAPSTKSIIDLLLENSQQFGDDIIEGKGKGTVILSSGLPGTGKTLTAEVYAEKARRPLYIVQCSQLGTDSDSLETLLREVLQRAQKWGAILLIDEADVYIRERGDDINQNAIVGVFLRLLEYYRGLMFLTTNRATIVDDAILSRCVVHVRYQMPDETERMRLWRTLSGQFGLALADSQIAYVASQFKVSGRTIKQLCRLMRMGWDSQPESVTIEYTDEFVKYVEWLYSFQCGTNDETQAIN